MGAAVGVVSGASSPFVAVYIYIYIYIYIGK